MIKTIPCLLHGCWDCYVGAGNQIQDLMVKQSALNYWFIFPVLDVIPPPCNSFDFQWVELSDREAKAKRGWVVLPSRGSKLSLT